MSCPLKVVPAWIVRSVELWQALGNLSVQLVTKTSHVDCDGLAFDNVTMQKDIPPPTKKIPTVCSHIFKIWKTLGTFALKTVF
jgi:hypothetical protein